MPCFACMLGGEDRRTLFMLTADWRMDEGFDDNIARLTTGPRTGRLLTAPARAGRRLAVIEARRTGRLRCRVSIASNARRRNSASAGRLASGQFSTVRSPRRSPARKRQ